MFDGTDYQPRRTPMIRFELSQDDCIKMLDMISDYPFKRVAPLIQTLQQQMLPQMQQQQMSPPPMQPRINGEDRAPGGTN
jgi:hypothetical protein